MKFVSDCSLVCLLACLLFSPLFLRLFSCFVVSHDLCCASHEEDIKPQGICLLIAKCHRDVCNLPARKISGQNLFFIREREGEVEIELLNERFRGLPSVEKQIYRLNKVSSCTQKVTHQR